MASVRRSKGWWFSLIAMLAIGTVWLIVRTGGHGPETARDFHLLGAPPGAGPLTDFRQHDRDGMQPEAASGSYRTPSTAAAILAHYRAACRRIGLTVPATSETLTYYPTALCDGPVIVTVTPTCGSRECAVFVEVVS